MRDRKKSKEPSVVPGSSKRLAVLDPGTKGASLTSMTIRSDGTILFVMNADASMDRKVQRLELENDSLKKETKALRELIEMTFLCGNCKWCDDYFIDDHSGECPYAKVMKTFKRKGGK